MTNAGLTSDAWTLAHTVSRIAGLLRGAGALSTGDVAALRRMNPQSPAAAFFKVEGLVLDERLPATAATRRNLETCWAAIIVGLAHLGDLHRVGPAYRLGSVLAEAGFSEVRFSRFLAADTDRLVDELPMVARYLTAKGTPVDWTDAARLILSAARHDEAEDQRRHLARDYYGTLTRKDRS